MPYGKARLGNGEALRVLPPLATGTCSPAEIQLEYMDWSSVDKAVMLQGLFHGEANSYIHTVVKQWHDRLIGSVLADPTERPGAGLWGERPACLRLGKSDRHG